MIKKELDITFIMNESKNMGISTHKYIKRMLNYKLSNKKEKCKNCRMKTSPVFDGEERTQCHWIGVNIRRSADIEINHVCNWYEPSYKGETDEEF